MTELTAGQKDTTLGDIAWSWGVLTSDDLAAGFTYAGELVSLIIPQRGIFCPYLMRYCPNQLASDLGKTTAGTAVHRFSAPPI